MAALTFYCPDSQPPQYFSSDAVDFFHLTHSQLPTFDAFIDDPFSDSASSFLFSTDDIYPYFSAPSADTLIPFPDETFHSDEFRCSKRHKLISADPPFFQPSFVCDGSYFPHPPELLSVPWDDGFVFNTQAPPPLPNVMKPSPNNLSAQTIAARERRRKITAKTQELGELIPGGNKMNTAEMFHSAFKYVKFLQAQVAILQLMQQTEEQEALGNMEELQILQSPIIQEKLYSEQKCLVPREFVENVANFSEIQSQPSIINTINQMLQTKSPEINLEKF